jgi:microcystin-dependent protein
VPMTSAPTTKVGQGAPHSNIQPYLAINFNICLSGIFPSRN